MEIGNHFYCFLGNSAGTSASLLFANKAIVTVERVALMMKISESIRCGNFAAITAGQSNNRQL